MPIDNSISPPSNLEASVIPGEVTLSWYKSTSKVDGYRIYENGSLAGTTPSILPLFEFPFSNESFSSPLIIFSEGEDFTFTKEIEPNTTYTYEICAFIGDSESTRISVTVRYEPYITITAVSIQPNPVYTNGDILLSAFVDSGINIIVN